MGSKLMRLISWASGFWINRSLPVSADDSDVRMMNELPRISLVYPNLMSHHSQEFLRTFLTPKFLHRSPLETWICPMGHQERWNELSLIGDRGLAS
jgi:hypothetical protein